MSIEWDSEAVTNAFWPSVLWIETSNGWWVRFNLRLGNACMQRIERVS